MLPNDPMILLSYVNTKLRDRDASLDQFCDRKVPRKRPCAPNWPRSGLCTIPAQSVCVIAPARSFCAQDRPGFVIVRRKAP